MYSEFQTLIFMIPDRFEILRYRILTFENRVKKSTSLYLFRESRGKKRK